MSAMFYMASLRYRPQNMIFSCLVLTNRPRASRMTEVWKGKGKLVKKEEPMGTKLDRLVVTAIACVVISWESLSLTCISFGVLVWSCHFLLIGFALVIFDSPSCSQLWSPRLETPSLRTMFFWCFRCLLTRMPFRPLSFDLFLGSPIFLILFPRW